MVNQNLVAVANATPKHVMKKFLKAPLATQKDMKNLTYKFLQAPLTTQKDMKTLSYKFFKAPNGKGMKNLTCKVFKAPDLIRDPPWFSMKRTRR